MVIRGSNGGIRIVDVKKGATMYKLMIKPRMQMKLNQFKKDKLLGRFGISDWVTRVSNKLKQY